MGCSISETALNLMLTEVICELLEALVENFVLQSSGAKTIEINLMERTSALE